MSRVCVHLPTIGVQTMQLDPLLPLQFPYKAKQASTAVSA